jgi:predicted nucleic acid-binding protein
MIKGFIDSSVFIAAIHSPRGGSGEVLRFAVAELFEAVISPEVVREAQNHFAQEHPDLLPPFQEFLELVPFTHVLPTLTDVEDAAAYTPSKDKAIVAGANTGKVDYLVTLDKKHLLGNEQIEASVGFKIVTPGEFLRMLRTLP